MKKNDSFFLGHILDAIQQIREYTLGVSEDQFYTNRLVQDAVFRQMEIIGEACRNISMELRNQHPKIPWHEMMGMRNRLIHAYFNISLEIVWEVVVNELDLLETEINAILKEI